MSQFISYCPGLNSKLELPGCRPLPTLSVGVLPTLTAVPLSVELPGVVDEVSASTEGGGAERPSAIDSCPWLKIAPPWPAPPPPPPALVVPAADVVESEDEGVEESDEADVLDVPDELSSAAAGPQPNASAIPKLMTSPPTRIAVCVESMPPASLCVEML
jgi:hypothetical protein